MVYIHSLHILHMRTMKARAGNSHSYIMTTCPPKAMTVAINSKDNGISPL